MGRGGGQCLHLFVLGKFSFGNVSWDEHIRLAVNTYACADIPTCTQLRGHMFAGHSKLCASGQMVPLTSLHSSAELLPLLSNHTNFLKTPPFRATKQVLEPHISPSSFLLDCCRQIQPPANPLSPAWAEVESSVNASPPLLGVLLSASWLCLAVLTDGRSVWICFGPHANCVVIRFNGDSLRRHYCTVERWKNSFF